MASSAATAPRGAVDAAPTKAKGGAALPDLQPLTGAKLILGAFALALANFVVVLDTTIANVSVPHIAGGLAVSPTQGTWTITSYAVADAISVPLTGWLSARFGSVRWFLMSLIGFATFSFCCGISNSLSMLVMFRVLQGLSGGPLMPLSQTLLMRIFPRERAPIGLAIWAMTTTAAPILGPILGGSISDQLTWPWIFFINLPIVAISFFLVRALITRYETPTAKRPIDVMGLVLLVVAVGAFQIMLDTGRENDWFNSTWIIGLAITAAIGFAFFIGWELTEREPIVDIRVFRNRNLAVATLAISLGFGAFFSQVVLTPLWLQQVIGYTATDAGYVVAWSGVFAVIGSPLAGRLISKVDVRMMVCFGLLWLAFVSVFRMFWNTDVGYWWLAMPHLLQGIGMPFFFIGLTSLALAGIPPQQVPSAAGLMSFCRTLSGAIGTALATTAWETQGTRAREGLVTDLNNVDPAMSQLQAMGQSVEQSRAAVDRLVEAQASTIGMIHVFGVAAVIFVVAAALVWLAKRPKPGGGAPPAAH